MAGLHHHPGARRGVEIDRPGTAAAILLAVALGGAVAATAAAVIAGPEAPRAASPPAGGVAVSAPADCRETLDAARTALDRARTVYDHWSGHVQAQLDYDAKRITLQQTRDRWAATKATADRDLTDFAAALRKLDAAPGGCTAPSAPPACAAEHDTVLAAVDAAKPMVAGWSAHVRMMKEKSHTDPRQYGKMWRDMVAAAPADLNAFRDVAARAVPSPGCSA